MECGDFRWIQDSSPGIPAFGVHRDASLDEAEGRTGWFGEWCLNATATEVHDQKLWITAPLTIRLDFHAGSASGAE